MITVKNLTISYQGQPVLKNVSESIPTKKIVGIIGPNGAGKSTLLKGMLSLVSKDSGEVYLNDKNILKQQKDIAYVPQRSEVDLTFPITVFETVLMGTYPKLSWYKKVGKEERNRAEACIKRLSLEQLQDKALDELSGGQLQRVFIARALAQEANFLFLDEPFVGIDVVSEKIIIDVLREQRNEGKSLLIVHHDLHKVYDYFDHLLIINKGIVASGKPEAVFTPDNLEEAYGEAFGELFFKKKVSV